MDTEGSMEHLLRRKLQEAGYMARRPRVPVSPNNLGGYIIVDFLRNTVGGGTLF